MFSSPPLIYYLHFFSHSLEAENYSAMIDENYGSRATQNNRFSYNYLVLWTIKKHPQNCLWKYILSIFLNSLLAQKQRKRKYLLEKFAFRFGSLFFSFAAGKYFAIYYFPIFRKQQIYALPSKHIKSNKNKRDWKAKCNFPQPTFLMLPESEANLHVETFSEWNLIKLRWIIFQMLNFT